MVCCAFVCTCDKIPTANNTSNDRFFIINGLNSEDITVQDSGPFDGTVIRYNRCGEIPVNVGGVMALTTLLYNSFFSGRCCCFFTRTTKTSYVPICLLKS